MTAPAPKDSPSLPALRRFHGDPTRAGRELRDAVHANSGAFLTALLNEPELDVADRGIRYAMALLLHNDALIPSVLNPTVTSFQQALRLTRCMLKMDSNFINSMLAAVQTRPHLISDSSCTHRLLDIIRECVDHLNSWRSIARIHRTGDSQVKMKCARLIAQFRFDDAAGLERFGGADPRVRANIVEMLWSTDKPRASALMEAATEDENNRVAGNAWVALYTAGHTRSLAGLAGMLEAPDEKRRITAAWAMGQTRDSRFGGHLLEASRSDIPELMKTAATGLSKLDAAPGLESDTVASRAEGPNVSFVSAPGADGSELWLFVAGPGGKFLPRIRPVDFFVWAGDELLMEYSVEESVHTSDAAVRIVYPAGSKLLESALKDSLANKPPGQCWALSRYGSGDNNTGSPASPMFEGDADALAALLDAGTVAGTDAAEAVKNVPGAESKLEQHMVLILDGPGPEPEALAAICQEKQIRLHCWRLRQDTGSTELAGVVRDEAQLAHIWPRFVASLRARYILRASRTPTAVAIRSAGTKRARFSGRTDLLKGGPNA